MPSLPPCCTSDFGIRARAHSAIMVDTFSHVMTMYDSHASRTTELATFTTFGAARSQLKVEHTSRRAAQQLRYIPLSRTRPRHSTLLRYGLLQWPTRRPDDRQGHDRIIMGGPSRRRRNLRRSHPEMKAGIKPQSSVQRGNGFGGAAPPPESVRQWSPSQKPPVVDTAGYAL